METKTSTHEMIDMIEQGVKDVLTSERWAEFLRFAARFHDYSLGNMILILMQRPDASYVAGYNTWQKMRRQVNKGERGIRILAPCVSKKTVEDDSGEEREIVSRYFKTVSVFDISQTSGEDVPTICDELHGDVENVTELTERIASAKHVLILRLCIILRHLLPQPYNLAPFAFHGTEIETFGITARYTGA